MNLGIESETVEFKRSTSELREGMESIASILNKHGHGELYLVNTRRRFVIDDYGPRKEIPELPKEAVREILFNAFCHRDWLSSARVQIDIFHDAVEITNPGWFVEGQDPEEHLAGDGGSSLSRNMLIAQALYRSGDIEAYGSGIPRVRDACKEIGVRIEYVRVPIGTKFIFHRNDAFESDCGNDTAHDGRQMADKWPIKEDGRQMADKWLSAHITELSDTQELCYLRSETMGKARPMRYPKPPEYRKGRRGGRSPSLLSMGWL